jgi:tetratricopeptide (TPR) repeat protein
MKDDESTSTHRIDVDALRKAARPKEPEDEPPTMTRASRPSQEEIDDVELASVTKIDISIPVPLPDDREHPSEPRTVNAPGVSDMIAETMGEVPSFVGRLADTAESDAHDIEDLATQTRLPLPVRPMMDPAVMEEVETTSVSLPDPNAASGPHSAVTMQLPQDLGYQQREEEHEILDIDDEAGIETHGPRLEDVGDVTLGPASDAETRARAFDDEADETRMARMNPAEVRAAFAAAEPAPVSSLSGVSIIVEGDPEDLESEPEIDDLAKTSGEMELPRFALASEIMPEPPLDPLSSSGEYVHPSQGEVELLSSPEGVEMLEDDVEDDDGGPTDVSLRAPKKTPKRGPDFVAPQIDDKPIVPAYALDPDSDEKQLQDERSWNALVDLYRLRIHDAETRVQRVALYHKLASVYEELGDRRLAFEQLTTAFDLDPTDAAMIESLDRVAKAEGRVNELVDRARKNLHTADPEARVALLGHLVYWYERVLGRGSEISPFIAEIERVDKTQPAALRKAAQIALSNGDAKSHRDLLARALERTARRDEKVALHLALASAWSGMPEAAKHYESALAYDPASIVALQGIERIGREKENHAQVEWALERQAQRAATGSEKVDALLRLAELQDAKFLRREKAAELLEQVLELEPANPAAMKALERCYHALRDWPRLARVLRLRAENTYDKKTQVELLLLAAEVLESKLGDAAGAIDAYRDLLHAEPKHRRALTDVARLYEKLGDWGNVAQYKARLAELASTKRQQSRELVALGDFLFAPERDPIAAKIQYENAVAVDPTNAAAWEALQRVASANGDDRRAAQCLVERAKYTDGPRQRATVYVELAKLEEHRGDLRAARDAFEQAIKADGTNELAAAFMLDAYTREERWKEAAPLCELLVNAAIRDKDSAALFTRLRLQTRISAALGDAERAMTAALSALDAQPNDPDAIGDLVAVCSQCREVPAVVARAKDHLQRIADTSYALPTDVMVRLAILQRDAREYESAALTLERALTQSGGDPEVQRELAETYVAMGDFQTACRLKVELARNATNAEARFKLLVEAGDIWAKKAHDTDLAANAYEEARRVKPQDPNLLHTLMTLYTELEAWDRLVSVLQRVAENQDTPEKKAKSLFALAQVARDKLGDVQRACDFFDAVLDVDKKRLDAFEELVRTLTAAKDWDRLDLAYRKMIARVKDDGDSNLMFVLFQQLGMVYRDRIEDAARAYEALEAAARIRPEDTGVRKMVHELLVVTDNIDNAVARTRELIEREPHDAELYAELYDLFLRQHYFDKAWCAVNVLSALRELTEEQQQFHQDYAPMALNEIPGQIVEQAWGSHVFHHDLDPTLTSIFALMTPAVARMRHSQLRPEQLVHAVGRPFTPKHSYLYDGIVQTFANAAEILGMRPPELLLGDPSAPLPFSPALAPFGALLVHVPAVEARAESLVYMAGRRLAEQRSELTARAFFPSVPDLTALLGAAVRISRQEGAKDAAGAALDASLGAMMTPDERNGIRSIVLQAAMEGGLVDVKRWSQAADLSSMRAGLLLCGDVEPARKSLLSEPLSAADLPPRERIGELFKFATSDLYSDLRGAIGVSVQS